MGKLLFYDKENDILSIHEGFSSNEKFKGNIDAGQFILDVSTNDKIRGIEVMNASTFFEVYNITEDDLDNLKDAVFSVHKEPVGFIIEILFSFKIKKEIPVKIVLPLTKKLVC